MFSILVHNEVQIERTSGMQLLHTLYAAFRMNCLAPGFQMAGTVSTHCTFRECWTVKPTVSAMNFFSLATRYLKAREKTSMAGISPPLMAESLCCSLNDYTTKNRNVTVSYNYDFMSHTAATWIIAGSKTSLHYRGKRKQAVCEPFSGASTF